MDQFIPKDVLDALSYHSGLGQSLKQISLRKTPLPVILKDIGKYRSNYIDVLVQENLIGSRFKSDASIMRKYEKTLRTGGGFKQCFYLHCMKRRYEKYMGDRKIYIIAKVFDRQGCIAYRCKTINEARCLPGTLEVLRADGVQIVILDDLDIYSEYVPYRYVEDMKEFIDQVSALNRAA